MCILPRANIVDVFVSRFISLLKNLKQVLSSDEVGLSPGGTHLRAVVRYKFLVQDHHFYLLKLVDYKNQLQINIK